jgi:membrane peptidoglycan carboxypeptidase
VYSWLFKTHRKHAQDKRIAGLIEVEAFLKIHAQWRKMGYPFDSLVPSYATTLGASADRPAALAELMGILVNGGVRKPVERIDSMHFAAGTPYETMVKRAPSNEGERVLSPLVARATLDAIRGVVAEGTAKRAKNAFTMSDGSVIAVGGKTGTGDQRFDVFAPGGRLIESRYVNRTATFVFNIGERFFGTMIAYVHGPDSENYDFTSALPVQLLVALAPSLTPMIEPQRANAVLAQGPTPKPEPAPAPAAAESADEAAQAVKAAPGSDSAATAKPVAPVVTATAPVKRDATSADIAAPVRHATATDADPAKKPVPVADAPAAAAKHAVPAGPAAGTPAKPAPVKQPARPRAADGEPAKRSQQPPEAPKNVLF